MKNISDTDWAARVAAAGAAVMIAAQIGAKATRDALFLSNFDIELLPAMLIAASVFSVVALLWASRAMARLTPQRLVPAAFCLSATLLIAEWALWYQAPRLATVVFYLHVAAFGAFVISGFWSIVNERFDPRTAKRKIGLIAASAALGGLVGGLVTAQVAVLFTVSTMLPLLGGMHLLSGLLVYKVRSSIASHHPSRSGPEMASLFSGLRFVGSVSYLRNIAFLVLVTGLIATLMDYVFKFRAVEAASSDAELARFFAAFYAGVGLATFILQTTLGRAALEKLGLSGTISFLPSMTAIGSLAMLVMPVLPTSALARGGEAAVRSSLFRSGYELLYTSVPLGQKRTAKPIVDVGFDRLADGVGAILVYLILNLFIDSATEISAMLAGAIALAVLALFLTGRLKQGYVDSLKGHLVDRADELNLANSVATIDSSVMQTLSSLDLSRVLGMRSLSKQGRSMAAREGAGRHLRQAPIVDDAVMSAMSDLRSDNPGRVRTRLKQRLDLAVSAQAISLLAWDEVSRDAVQALRGISDKIVEGLTDALLDPGSAFSVRRRIPRVLSVCDSPRAVGALLSGLEDERFEVRYQCASALSAIRTRLPKTKIPEEWIQTVVLRELDSDPTVWAGRRLLDLDKSSETDRLLGERADLNLKHVFQLLSLFHDKEPLQIALKGLYTDDPQLRGTALEYLESVLPQQIQKRLLPFLEERPHIQRPAKRDRDLHSELLQSKQSIEINLANLRKKY